MQSPVGKVLPRGSHLGSTHEQLFTAPKTIGILSEMAKYVLNMQAQLTLLTTMSLDFLVVISGKTWHKSRQKSLLKKKNSHLNNLDV